MINQNKSKNTGKLFVIDGTDGSGKQTQFTKLQERLEKDNIDFIKNYSKISNTLILPVQEENSNLICNEVLNFINSI